jgi:hypothetical protein
MAAVDFGLELVNHAVEEMIQAVGGAARIGMGYTRWLSGSRFGSEGDTHDAARS